MYLRRIAGGFTARRVHLLPRRWTAPATWASSTAGSAACCRSAAPTCTAPRASSIWRAQTTSEWMGSCCCCMGYWSTSSVYMHICVYIVPRHTQTFYYVSVDSSHYIADCNSVMSCLTNRCCQQYPQPNLMSAACASPDAFGFETLSLTQA